MSRKRFREHDLPPAARECADLPEAVLRISKRRWWPIAAAATVLPITAALITQAGFFRRSDVRLEVDLSRRILYAIQNDEVIAEYGISVGSDRHPTPDGSYTVSRIVWNPPEADGRSTVARRVRLRTGDKLLGVKIYFSDSGYFIHGTNDPELIGSAAARGCIRMDVRDAEELARVLMDHGGARKSEDWFERVIRSPDDTHVIILPLSVGMDIGD